jgi:hypothetical protein
MIRVEGGQAGSHEITVLLMHLLDDPVVVIVAQKRRVVKVGESGSEWSPEFSKWMEKSSVKANASIEAKEIGDEENKSRQDAVNDGEIFGLGNICGESNCGHYISVDGLENGSVMLSMDEVEEMRENTCSDSSATLSSIRVPIQIKGDCLELFHDCGSHDVCNQQDRE